MSLLVRKVNKAKWMQTDLTKNNDVSADAITNCLKTSMNTLSTWEINSQDEIDEAVLAIVSSHDHLETIDVVPLEYEHLKSSGVDSEKTEGSTPVIELREKHRDLSNLSYTKLGIIAYHIVDQIRGKIIFRYTERKLKDILFNAITANRLSLKDLSESLQRKLKNRNSVRS